ncbi:DUF6404 family protein [Candidatus Pantoea formicae]|uniref:DUF6404 family protein n=1 Tax=Candidatus Pantoea formicae TaxID=2608355 RepID=UPI003EDB46D2
MNDAEFKRKTDRAFALLEEKALRECNRIPLTYRLLWSAGIKVPPALFASFGSNVCVLGAYFAVFYGCIMWLITWRPQGMSPLTSAVTSLLAGLFYGICMAAVFRKRRKAMDLPVWEQL